MHNKHLIGQTGEKTACAFLMKRGYVISNRNYRKKWGEIDIIATFKGKLHFVEVKTVSREITSIKALRVPHETINDYFRPEENVHPQKIARLHRTIESYLIEKRLKDIVWQLDVIAVYLDMKSKKARVCMTENIVL